MLCGCCCFFCVLSTFCLGLSLCRKKSSTSLSKDDGTCDFVCVFKTILVLLICVTLVILSGLCIWTLQRVSDLQEQVRTRKFFPLFLSFCSVIHCIKVKPFFFSTLSSVSSSASSQLFIPSLQIELSCFFTLMKVTLGIPLFQLLLEFRLFFFLAFSLFTEFF